MRPRSSFSALRRAGRALAALAALAAAQGCGHARASAGEPGVVFHDDFNGENGGIPHADFRSLRQWTVVSGSVDLEGRYPFELLPPGNGLYVDLDGSLGRAATLRTRRPLVLDPGTYILSFQLSGCRHVSRSDVVHVALGPLLRERIEMRPFDALRTFTRRVAVRRRAAVYLELAHEGGDNFGMLLDNVVLRRE